LERERGRRHRRLQRRLDDGSVERGARLITDARFSVGSTSACVTPLLNPRSRSAHSYPPHCMAHVERCIDVHLYDRTSTPQSPLHRFANSRLRLSLRARVFPGDPPPLSLSLPLSLSISLPHRVRREKQRRAFRKQKRREAFLRYPRPAMFVDSVRPWF